MRKQCLTIVASLAAVLGMTTIAQADDLYPPPWRGDPGSTFQQWTFDDGDNPAIPELSDNPYGTPTATMGGPLANWFDQNGFPRQGLWGDLDSIDLWIPNQPEPNLYKEIWVQVTYMKIEFDPFYYSTPTVEVPDATYLGGADEFLEYNNPAYPELGEWRLQLSQWRLDENPPDETIFLSWPPFGGEWPRGTVDQIVVDTICIPEPAALVLFTLGGFLLARRRS
jgi:hypothetical protein